LKVGTSIEIRFLLPVICTDLALIPVHDIMQFGISVDTSAKYLLRLGIEKFENFIYVSDAVGIFVE